MAAGGAEDTHQWFSLKKCPSQKETLLDEEGWKSEARAVVKELESYVLYIDLSSNLLADNNQIYLNVTTKENTDHTVHLSCQGFKIVGNKFDSSDIEGMPVYETAHSLLDNLSPGYREAFGAHLSARLLNLQKLQEQERE